MATLLDQPDVTISFPIVKFDTTDDGDLIVYGKATDGSVDSDEQIVDPEWSAKAIQDWLATGGNVRVQHNPHRDPAGKGLEVEVGKDGHWVKSLVVEPTAKRLVEKGVLRAYSVGIMRPQIVRDAKARGGRIVGGEIGEISLVDRPANKNCGITLVKADKTGAPEYVGKVFGDGDYIAKVGGGVSSGFSPADMARLVKAKTEAEVVKRGFDPNVGGGVDRDKIPAQDFVDPERRRFPIVTSGDVSDAVSSYGRAKPKIPFDEFKRRLTAIARRKGPEFVAELPEEWKKDTGKKAAKPDTAGTGGGKPPKPTCPKCGMKAKRGHQFCAKCGTKLTAADAVKGRTPGDGIEGKDTTPVPGHREPDGPQTEILEEDAGLDDGDEDREGDSEPTPTWQGERERRKTAADYATIRLHDALCAAYHPDTVYDAYPALKTAADAVDVHDWQETAMALVAKGDLDAGEAALRAARAAQVLKEADPAAVADARAELHKGFADMYPDVHLTPGEITPGRFRRPYITEGHAPLSAAAPGDQPPAPNAREITADDFTRGYLTQGHAANSPAAGKGVDADGVYASAQRAQARAAMQSLHDHVAARYPELCPMADTPTPSPAGAGLAATKAEAVKKAAKKAAKKAEKKLLKRIEQLEKQLAEIGSQPDPSAAPLRGIVSKHASGAGGAAPVERRSLVDEARNRYVAYLDMLTKSGDPQIREEARSVLAKYMSDTTTTHA